MDTGGDFVISFLFLFFCRKRHEEFRKEKKFLGKSAKHQIQSTNHDAIAISSAKVKIASNLKGQPLEMRIQFQHLLNTFSFFLKCESQQDLICSHNYYYCQFSSDECNRNNN